MPSDPNQEKRMRAHRVAMIAAFVAASLAVVTVASAQPAQKTASQFYMDYYAACDKAKKMEDLLPWMSAKSRAEMEAMPAAERPKMFELFKMLRASNVKVVKETRTTDGATLTVEGIDTDKKKATGTVDIVKEKGEWKIGQEKWQS
jgi:hypothetical protein